MITALEVLSTRPFLDGMAFGAAGAYLHISASATGEIDPETPAHAVIGDLRRAPRNARGMVEYRTDIVILRPADAACGNGRMLYEVTNRGRKQMFNFLCDASSANGGLTAATDVGNAFTLKRGFTIVWSGWDATASPADSGVTMSGPLAMENGRPMVKTIRDEFAFGTTHAVADLVYAPRGEMRLSFEAASQDKAQARLSTRQRPGDAPSIIPSEQWEYIDSRTIRLRPAGTMPVPGLLYDFHYPATNSPVVGLGLAVTRDVVSHLRQTNAAGTSAEMLGRPMSHVIAMGVSQAGRYLRNHMALGFNRDESGKRVFDGVLSFIGGVGGVFQNEAFATPFRTRYPHQDHDFPENEFPFSAARETDPLTGKAGSLFHGGGCDPKLMDVNTSGEYWKKGASLAHTDPLGTRDAELPADARAYLITGTHHGARQGTTTDRGPCLYPVNPQNPVPFLRALLSALDTWVSEGTPPPDSRIPRIADGTLRDGNNTGFPKLPGVRPMEDINDVDPPGDWVDLQPPTHRYQPRVSRVDANGNEVAGIIGPDIAVPLGTHTGWNRFRSPLPEDAMADRYGSYFAFAKTRAERERTGDPRLSLEERYPSQADYVARVAAATEALVKARLLLPEDALHYIELARAAGMPYAGRK